jgi:hypothetical protein
MALHQELSGTEIHTPFAFVYADATARENATELTSSDEQKLALQTDDYSLWVLADSSGPTWIEVGTPQGGIIMWSGSIDSIPSGWALCDGTNGTPDLRNRFVIAAGGNYDVGATGDGSIPSHTHAFSATTNSTGSHTHSHTLDRGYFGNASGIALVEDKYVYNTTQYSLAAGAHAHNVSGTTSANGAGVQNIAVYYALAYIMKL